MIPMYNAMSRPATVLTATETQDGDYNIVTTWTDGTEVLASIVPTGNSSAQTETGDVLTASYRVSFNLSPKIAFDIEDRLRTADGTVFRMESVRRFGDTVIAQAVKA